MVQNLRVAPRPFEPPVDADHDLTPEECAEAIRERIGGTPPSAFLRLAKG